MKALHDGTQNLLAERIARDLAARVAAVFGEYPMLCGFSVQKRSTLTKGRALAALQGELCLADVSLLSDFYATQEFCEALVFTLLDLLEEHEEAPAFLAGRTFARALH